VILLQISQMFLFYCTYFGKSVKKSYNALITSKLKLHNADYYVRVQNPIVKPYNVSGYVLRRLCSVKFYKIKGKQAGTSSVWYGMMVLCGVIPWPVLELV